MAEDLGPHQPNILVVDDQAGLRQLLDEYLSAVGFRVRLADNGRSALVLARAEPPDLVLLDIMMPRMDGLTFLQTFRKESRAPVILLTARLAEADIVTGLELGADDYLTKPFGMRELVARIRAVLRRGPGEAAVAPLLQMGDLALDRSRRVVTVAGSPVQLTPTEFDLLALLMATPGKVFPRRELLAHLQGPLATGSTRTVDVHIHNLRAKIEPDPARPRYIVLDYGIGYRLAEGGAAAPASRAPGDPPAPGAAP